MNTDNPLFYVDTIRDLKSLIVSVCGLFKDYEQWFSDDTKDLLFECYNFCNRAAISAENDIGEVLLNSLTNDE